MDSGRSCPLWWGPSVRPARRRRRSPRAAFALTQPFDAAIAADSGDAWADLTLGTHTFNPLVLAPGATGTINVTITPDPSQVGEVVQGYLYIDTFNPNAGTGDEVVRIPYSYTVAK